MSGGRARWAAILLMACGCGPERTPRAAAADLWMGKADRRLDAANDILDALNDGKEVPPEVIGAVIERLSVERNTEVRRRLMKVLVETGDPSVQPVLNAYMQTMDYDEQRYAAELYQRYAVKTGKHPGDADFPRRWPYGTHGFPPKVHGGVVWIEDAEPPPKFMVKAEIGVTTRVLYRSRSIVAFDLDNTFAARTCSGIWGARTGFFQGQTEGGLHIAQYRVGPVWEAPFEFVRPMILLRLTLLEVTRNTDVGPAMRSLGFGLHAGVAVDFWRHPLDHAVYMSMIGGFDGWPDHYILPGGTIAFGGRY